MLLVLEREPATGTRPTNMPHIQAFLKRSEPAVAGPGEAAARWRAPVGQDTPETAVVRPAGLVPQDLPHASEAPNDGQHAQKHDVRAAQQKLKDMGYDPGPIDGKMGRQTRAAVKQFQQAQNIS